LEDPGSGLFAFRRSVLEGVQLRPDGYKMLMEVAARGNWRAVANVNYTFAERYAGNSNAGMREGLVFFRHLARLALTSRGRTGAGGIPAATAAATPGLVSEMTTAPTPTLPAAVINLP
jgi:dolichol-phosphate mannosyltransferase